MPLPAKLPVKLVADFRDVSVQEDIRKYLLEYETPCEYMGECDAQAMYGHLTAWTALWLCTEHYNFVWSRSPNVRAVLDRRLSEERYERFLRRSYVHQNNLSGFDLEKNLLEEREEERKKQRTETQRLAHARSEIRKGLAAQTIKVGAPDEDLLLARQRTAVRNGTGMPFSVPQLF